MKRQGNLIEKIADVNNLYLAFYKAKKGKQYKHEVEVYAKNIHQNIRILRQQILSGNVSVGKYHYFTIYEPKKRQICAAAFDERVLHHAIMNICHQYFEKTLIYDTYATRIDKGIYKALDKAKLAINQYSYLLKLDYRKYFDSISHEILKRKLAAKFKDEKLLHIFEKIIDSYCSTNGYGLPIGNLTSQYFANFFLSDLDHFIKEKLNVKFYVRYMDDMLLMFNDKTNLNNCLNAIENFSENLDLNLKPFVKSNVNLGVSFLGYKLYPHRILLNRVSKLRFKTKKYLYDSYVSKGFWSIDEYCMHITPLLGFINYAFTKKFRQFCVFD